MVDLKNKRFECFIHTFVLTRQMNINDTMMTDSRFQKNEIMKDFIDCITGSLKCKEKKMKRIVFIFVWVLLQTTEVFFIFCLVIVVALPKLGEIRLSILSNNEKIADCTLKMVKPNLAAYECLDFLAQVLGVDSSDKQSIDAKLVTLFDKSIPSDGTLAEIMKIQAQDMPFQERKYQQCRVCVNSIKMALACKGQIFFKYF